MKTSERKAWAEKLEDKVWAQDWAETRKKVARRSKYRAKITEVDGIKFASKLEADRYKQLKLLKASGEICYFLRQVPFDLPGGSTYRCDFMVVSKVWKIRFDPLENTYGYAIEFEDCKGYMTPMSKLKIKQVEALYPVNIKILTRKDIGK
jgi:Protein of unknown function (DUF1064)